MIIIFVFLQFLEEMVESVDEYVVNSLVVDVFGLIDFEFLDGC